MTAFDTWLESPYQKETKDFITKDEFCMFIDSEMFIELFEDNSTNKVGLLLKEVGLEGLHDYIEQYPNSNAARIVEKYIDFNGFYDED